MSIRQKHINAVRPEQCCLLMEVLTQYTHQLLRMPFWEHIQLTVEC